MIDVKLGASGRKILILVMAAVMCMVVGSGGIVEASAAVNSVRFEENEYDGQIGVVTTSALNVRQGPGTEYKSIGLIYMNREVQLMGAAYDSKGVLWYKFLYNGTEGYSSSEYMDIKRVVKYDYNGDFEAYMTEEGFPESYKPYLRNLHAAYPQWVFKAANTNVDWTYAIDRQSRPGVSLIGLGSPASWKSTAPGAYDPDTGEYISYDSGGWVTASRELVEYYVDPRNFLNEVGVFQFLGHAYDGNTQSIEGLRIILSDSFMADDFPEDSYSTYADLLMDVGEKSGVNPYVLASMIILEQGRSGYGGSISGTISGYEGYYNFFNINAYRSGSLSAVSNGLRYASQSGPYGRPWDTRAKSIFGGATYYGDKYVRGNQYNQYLKKFNVMNGADRVATGQYMTNIAGAEHEASILRVGYKALLSSPMTFVIPIYNDMPSLSCPKPGSSGDNDFYLKRLSVDGYSLVPDFSARTSKYELLVAHDADSVSISAQPNSSGATVSGIGAVSLPDKDNEIRVTVMSSSGSTNTYTIMISKKDPPALSGESAAEGGGDTPPASGADGSADVDSDVGSYTGSASGTTVQSSAYSFGDKVTGIAEKTSVEDFAKNVKVEKGSYDILDKDGALVESGLVGTGMRLVLYDNSKKTIKEYPIVIKGDVSGDGKINSLDTLLVEKHIVRMIKLDGAYLAAADSNGDGKVNSVDTLIIEKHVVRLSLMTP